MGVKANSDNKKFDLLHHCCSLEMHMENGLVVIHLLYTAHFFCASYYDISAPAGLVQMTQNIGEILVNRYACRKTESKNNCYVVF
jgi:hypothetical protein